MANLAAKTPAKTATATAMATMLLRGPEALGLVDGDGSMVGSS